MCQAHSSLLKQFCDLPMRNKILRGNKRRIVNNYAPNQEDYIFALFFPLIRRLPDNWQVQSPFDKLKASFDRSPESALKRAHKCVRPKSRLSPRLSAFGEKLGENLSHNPLGSRLS